MSRARLKVNNEIVHLLERALRAAQLERCAVDREHQDAMKLYLDTWVVGPLRFALDQIKGSRE